MKVHRILLLGLLTLAVLESCAHIPITPDEAACAGKKISPSTPKDTIEKQKTGLTTKEILAIIRLNLNQIRHCYEADLKLDPKAQGKVGVQFEIGKTGSVTNACVIRDRTTYHSTGLHACIDTWIKSWKFPEPRGGETVTVNYPFVFTQL